MEWNLGSYLINILNQGTFLLRLFYFLKTAYRVFGNAGISKMTMSIFSLLFPALVLDLKSGEMEATLQVKTQSLRGHP